MPADASLLPIVLAADNHPSPPLLDPFPTSTPTFAETYTPFHLTFADYRARLPPVGLLRPHVLAEMEADAGGSEAGGCPWQFFRVSRPARRGDEEEQVDELRVECVFFAEWVVQGGMEGMRGAVRGVVQRWRQEGKFVEPLAGWRDEEYMIYAPPQSSALQLSKDRKAFANGAFPLERSACAIFGFATFGVHLTVYEGEGKDMQIWVPRRSATKATWPSRLDNSVAGGIPAGMIPIDCMVKECDEEASLPEDLVRSRVRSVGVCTYFYVTTEGYLQPEIEYIYDLKLPPRDDPAYVRPRPHDDEVESFALLSVSEVITALHSGEFKPNCGLILVDFLMRHGLITPENEPNYLEISWRMHRRLAVAVPM